LAVVDNRSTDANMLPVRNTFGAGRYRDLRSFQEEDIEILGFDLAAFIHESLINIRSTRAVTHVNERKLGVSNCLTILSL
jgi:hypothetical protein